MTVSRAELIAFADGELAGPRARAVEAAIAADPALQRDLARHRALKAQLRAHFDPIAAEPIPASLTALLQPSAGEASGNVVGLAAARERKAARARLPRLPRWSWVAGPALAASLAFAILVPRGGDGDGVYADAQLAGVLDERLVAQQSPGDGTRVLVSFRDRSGAYCRAFSGAEGGGIACRDAAGWKLAALGEGSAGATTTFRMAGAGDAAILARAQMMAAGSALDADQEAEARARNWR